MADESGEPFGETPEELGGAAGAATLKTARAWAIKEILRDLWHHADAGCRGPVLRRLVQLGHPQPAGAGEERGADDQDAAWRMS